MAATEPRDVHQGSSWKRGRGWLNFLCHRHLLSHRPPTFVKPPTSAPSSLLGWVTHPGVCLDAISRSWLYSIIKDRYWIKRDSIPGAVLRLISAPAVTTTHLTRLTFPRSFSDFLSPFVRTAPLIGLDVRGGNFPLRIRHATFQRGMGKRRLAN